MRRRSARSRCIRWRARGAARRWGASPAPRPARRDPDHARRRQAPEPRAPARRQRLHDQTRRRGGVRAPHRLAGEGRRGAAVVKILIVDPDATRASALKVALAAAGAEVTVASSGAFALTMLEWNRHDIVVSRARIDDMDGHELCAILKSDPSTRHIRFGLVAGANEVTPVQTTVAGV